jgi:hypothetical protein
MEGKRRRERRHKQLRGDLKEKILELKKTLAYSLWRTHFGRSYRYAFRPTMQ